MGVVTQNTFWTTPHDKLRMTVLDEDIKKY